MKKKGCKDAEKVEFGGLPRIFMGKFGIEKGSNYCFPITIIGMSILVIIAPIKILYFLTGINCAAAYVNMLTLYSLKFIKLKWKKKNFLTWKPKKRMLKSLELMKC